MYVNGAFTWDALAMLLWAWCSAIVGLFLIIAAVQP